MKSWKTKKAHDSKKKKQIHIFSYHIYVKDDTAVQWGQRTVSSIDCTGSLDYPYRRNCISTSFHVIHRDEFCMNYRYKCER